MLFNVIGWAILGILALSALLQVADNETRPSVRVAALILNTVTICWIFYAIIR